METVESKISAWDRQLDEMREAERFNSTWVNSVMGECVNILENRKERSVRDGKDVCAAEIRSTEVLLEFLSRMFSEILCVQHTFGCAKGKNLCVEFKKLLAVKHGEMTDICDKTLAALISILKTVEKAKAEYPCRDIYPRTIFDNIPRTIIELDIDYVVKEFFCSLELNLVNKTAEFYYNLWCNSTPKPVPQRILPFLEDALPSFNLRVNRPMLDRVTALELLNWAVSTLDDISVDILKQVRVFTARVLPSDFWTAEQKINTLNLMEMYRDKASVGIQDTTTKLTVEFPCLITMVQDAMVNLEPLRFVAYMFKKDLKFSALHIPEFQHLTDPAETSQITHLLYSLCFQLQNLLISASGPQQIPYVWELSHEVIEYLLRLCKSDKNSIPYATFLKNIVLHSSTTFTIRKFVFQMIHPRDACLELMQYLLSWTDALTLMALSGPPLQVESFKEQNARTSKYNSVTIILLELDGWLELLKKDDQSDAGAAHVDEERKKIIRIMKSNIRKMLEVTGAWPKESDMI